MTPRRPALAVMIYFLTSVLTACGGGGGGSSPTPSAPGGNVGGTSTPTPSPGPTAIPTSSPAATISGTAVDYTTGAPLVGFTVTIGSLPGNPTCAASQTASANPCGVPAAPVSTATTSATGTFSLPATVGDEYMLSIAPPTANSYATLHRTVNLVSSASAGALGTLKISALSSDEQAWLADVNAVRALISVPTSYANLTVDEYAEEQARAEANAVANGTAPYSNATELAYINSYDALPNIIYTSAGSVQAVQPDPLAFSTTYGTAPLTVTLPAGSRGYQAADAGWMYGAIQNCSNDNWQTCAVNSNNDTYVTIANTADVWAGLGESTNASPTLGGKVYEILFPQT